MTAAQLARLAELSASAAAFYARTNPASARLFADAALRADALSAELHHREELARIGAELTAVREDVTRMVAR